MIGRLLVANRGEIALRVFRAARELGIETVGVFPRGDSGAAHLQHCSRVERLEGDDARAAYLDIEGLVAAASRAGADALHPGYGFLSENPLFARRVEEAGIVFVGPAPATMEAFGVKTVARRLAKEAGVPTVPGTEKPVESTGAALDAAARIGYPVVLKASYGGGGRGIRRVEGPEGMAQNFEAAAREAQLSFGNGELYVEKFLACPRHIEVQILGDGTGAAVHLFERDCSMQRRNQKLIEESPAPNLEESLRARITQDALRVARAGAYRSAGTVEFLVVGGQHFFLEVNARLQVEHPVSEAVTGLDIVRLQLELAGGTAPLPDQESIRLHGHAIECRVNAEDPRANFLPHPGRVVHFEPPGGPGVRVDAGFKEGGEVSPLFDSLMAKLIVHGPTREAARARALRALEDFVIIGVPTTVPFHRFALSSAPFVSGRYDTSTVAGLGPLPAPADEELEAAALAVAVARFLRPARPRGAAPRGPRGERGQSALRPAFGPRAGGWFHEV